MTALLAEEHYSPSSLGKEDRVSARALYACALLAVVACASGASGRSAIPPSSAGRDRDVITQEEVVDAKLGAQSVLDVVRSLRPHFLNVRGTNSHSDDEAGKVHASIDGGRIIALSELGLIHASMALEIRYLTPAAAMQKFGGAAREGPVILVKTM